MPRAALFDIIASLSATIKSKQKGANMKKTFINADLLSRIIEKYPTPFHLYDERGIRANAKNLHRAFTWNAGYKEYFAVKANPNPEILKILKEEGCGVDCSSLTELMLAEAVGFSGDQIMFSANAMPAEELIYARKLGAIINLDDFSHIDFLDKHAGIPETICCRFNPGGTFKVSNDIMDNPGEAKYGFTKNQLLDGFKKLQAKGAKNFGLHSFLASNTLTNDYYPSVARILFETAVWLHEQTGAHIRFINLSGGIGIPMRPDEKANNIFEIASLVQRAYEDILIPAGMSQVAIFTELGRFMLGPYGCLVATAIHEKKIYKNYIGLDASAVDLMRPAMYGAYHHITVAGKEDAPHSEVYDVTGALCENNDKFAIDRALPKIQIGDHIILHDTGAHGYAMGYNYNGRLKSAEILLKENDDVVQIRRAETPSDYFATLSETPYYKKLMEIKP